MNYYTEIRDYAERLGKMLSDPDNRAEMKQTIDEALEKHGEMWLVAALIHGSTGYYQHNTAMANVVNPYKRGEEVCYSERAYACFRADLIWMLWCDVGIFNRLAPEKQVKKIAYAIYAGLQSSEAQWSLSSLYPTDAWGYEEALGKLINGVLNGDPIDVSKIEEALKSKLVVAA